MAVVVPIVSEWNPKGVNKSIADIKSAEGAWGKAGATMKAAALPAAAALGAIAVAAVDFSKAAIEDQKSAALLADALKQTAGASDATVKSTEDWISAQGKALGVADDQLRPALATLARATGDVAKSQDLAALAMNVSAATGKDLGSVSSALGKAYGGQATALKKLIPGLDDAVLKSGDFAAIQDMVAKKVGNAADVAANTAAGKMGRFTLAMDEAKESIGYALLPAIEAVLGPLQSLGEWFQNNTQVILIIGGVIAGLAVTILAVNAAMAAYGAITTIVSGVTKAWTAAQWLLNAAMTANPIGVVVVAIAAFVAILVLAYNKCDWFRNLVDAAWRGILQVTEVVWGAIQTAISVVWDWMLTLFSVTPFGILIKNFDKVKAVGVAVWEAIQGAVSTLWDWMKALFDISPFGFLIKHFDELKTIVETVFGAIRDFIKGALDKIAEYIAKIVGAVSGAIDKMKEFAKNIPVIGGLFGADGGSPTASYLFAGSDSPAIGSRTPSITINVQAGVGDPVLIARQIEATLRQRSVRLGVA